MDHVYCFHFYGQVYNEVSILSGPSMKHERVKIDPSFTQSGCCYYVIECQKPEKGIKKTTLNLAEKSSND